MADLEFDYLADHPQLVPRVIEWWQTVWSDRMGDPDKAAAQLRACLSRDELPIHILAFRDGHAVGVAALKLQELIELYPDRQYWLGSVFVAQPFRGAGVASALIQKVVDLAISMGLPQLYLQTIDPAGGLYGRLGWRPIESFNYKGEDTLLMVRDLK